jgi:excinuclease ABC subunit B
VSDKRIVHGPDRAMEARPLRVVSPYEPAGDQPKAIADIARGIADGVRHQTLLGVTGSGKTFTMAKVVESVQKPTAARQRGRLLRELLRLLPA